MSNLFLAGAAGWATSTELNANRRIHRIALIAKHPGGA
jgi:hypothetical protein